jgi:hypothetical protein
MDGAWHSWQRQVFRFNAIIVCIQSGFSLRPGTFKSLSLRT